MSFHQDGCILDDRKLGFVDVVSQFDEGALGVKKDKFAMSATPLTLTVDQHHGKVIECSGSATQVVNLPAATTSLPVGTKFSFKCVTDNGLSFNPSLQINAYNSAGAAATIFRGHIVFTGGATALGTSRSTLSFNVIALGGIDITCEFNGTYWMVTGSSVAAFA